MADNQIMMKVTRSSDVKNDLDQAILWLNSIYFEAGSLVMVNYRVSKTEVDAVLALGLRSGTGRSCYKIISATKKGLIWGVFKNSEDIPDVSTLDHEEDFLYYDQALDKWYIINNKNKRRTFTEISDTPQTFINLADGTTWVSNESRKVARLNDLADLYNKEEIDRKIDYAKNSSTRYVQFSDLTTDQKEQIRGPQGEKGDKGERGDRGLQGEPGTRGYNGTIENFVVLSQADYDALEYLDPYKFYFTYEEEDQQEDSDFYAYVADYVLNIDGVVNDHVLEINPAFASVNNNILQLSTSSSMTPSPIFTPIEGTYDGTKTITITCPDNEAEIYYTLDRTIPNENSIHYTGPITLDQSTVINARAYKPGLLGSKVITAAYNLIFPLTVETPRFNVNSGSYNDPFYLNITCETKNAIIRYTLDGTEPNETSTIFLSQILIEGSSTIVRAKAFKGGLNPSETITGTYVITNVNSVDIPRFVPEGGIYNEPQAVRIYSLTDGAKIRYTLDGSDPGTNLQTYTYLEPIIINTTTTIRARGERSGMEPSNIAEQTYIIDDSPTPPPQTDDPTVENNTLDNIQASVLDNTLYLPSSSLVENNILTL